MSDLPQGKKCSRCKRTRERAAFASNKSMRGGLQAYCKECAAEYYKERQEAKGRAVRVKVSVPHGHKRCPQCTEVKPHAEWEPNPTSSDGYSSYCKICRAERNQRSYFKRKYGITMAERDELVLSQAGVCCICLAAPAVHVDHCHDTGRVRGVLCFSCNAALGQFKDRPDSIRRAAAYVEGNAWKPTLVAQGVYRLPS
ncbi:endonuclease VII domain-containing protein [Streptomyces sp. Je 1-369]|uniref:endonuclease VII domain-containing protein n=1 Tax=Streptomyces sp. Je 1-369 TaxID=2966192 RepID=UPI0022862C97|nr:endonuclease VII domain-containing protein [Streptomyces sp. Je 1-369]WAL94491.1 endonuclease VII domain-containing protein [Streptomyces sp. Je 1-369]